jgi:hypothetical protein
VIREEKRQRWGTHVVVERRPGLHQHRRKLPKALCVRACVRASRVVVRGDGYVSCERGGGPLYWLEAHFDRAPKTLTPITTHAERHEPCSWPT